MHISNLCTDGILLGAYRMCHLAQSDTKVKVTAYFYISQILTAVMSHRCHTYLQKVPKLLGLKMMMGIFIILVTFYNGRKMCEESSSCVIKSSFLGSYPVQYIHESKTKKARVIQCNVKSVIHESP